jgi:hypothetical protein
MVKSCAQVPDGFTWNSVRFQRGIGRRFQILERSDEVCNTRLRADAPSRASLVVSAPYFFNCASSVISSRRPRRTCSGGAGIVISSTPSLNLALAWSVIAPSGSGINR